MSKGKKVKEDTEPKGDPLDKKVFSETDKHGVQRQVSIPHLGYVKDIKFLPYHLPPNPKECSEADIEEWLERMEFINRDLTHLLKLEHHRFWCQVIYDKSLHVCLDYYLKKAPRFYHFSDLTLTEDMKKSFQQVHHLAFLVYLRMSTHKETTELHITPHVFGNWIYNYYLFDIPKIMDLCTLFGKGNEALLSKMVNNIFSNNEKYHKDLQETVPTILKVFDTILDKLGLIELALRNQDEPAVLGTEQFCLLRNLEWAELEDTLFYCVDVCITLDAFLTIYPAACIVFHRLEITARIPGFYHSVFPAVKAELQLRYQNEELRGSINMMRRKLKLAEQSLVRLFRNLLSASTMQPILDGLSESNDNSAVVQYIEEFLNILCNILHETSFIVKYQESYPFEDDIEILNQSAVAVDPWRLDYILNSIYSAYEIEGKSMKCKAIIKVEPSFEDPLPQYNKNPPLENGDINFMSLEGACAGPKIEGKELEDLIHQVLDVISDLGEGFVEACLEYHNYNTEKVIDMLLENKLPPSLQKLDRFMQRNFVIPEETPIILRSKKEDNDFMALLDDRKDNPVLREVYSKYGIINDEYEDEYDDTYDGHIGPLEPNAIDVHRRPFTIPPILRGNEKVESSEEEEEEEIPENTNRKDHFIENPEVIRARNEARRQQQQERRGNYNVKGNTPGHGQSKEVLRNRGFKEQHKARGANHNRRAQSDRKRAGGMIH